MPLIPLQLPAGGTAGASTAGDGGAGGTSSFGTYCTATGGAGGDALIIRGHDIEHWRDVCEIDWQNQLFLHYVFADGKRKRLKYNGKENLSHHHINID